ncbi:MAG: AAA family ATPase [Planctomycetota bacterium]
MAADETSSEFQQQIDLFGRTWGAITEQLGRVIVGQQEVVEQVLTAVFAGGHALLEGVPGLGKTLLVRTLADAMDLAYSRIQFTPDLMPADIIGTNVLQTDGAGNRSLQFQPGPIFANLILADEINRATPKTQSAVLEAMSEQTVSVARTSHELAGPFFVLATQNPLEMEGTYPLPEAQLDRFLLKIRIDPPPVEELARILQQTTTAQMPGSEQVASADDVLSMQQTVRRVIASEAITRFVAGAVLQTSPDNPQAPETVRRNVRYGASPRGAQAVLLAAKVRALVAGRANVDFADIEAVFAPALRHRLILSFEGQAEGVNPDEILSAVLAGGQRAPDL